MRWNVCVCVCVLYGIRSYVRRWYCSKCISQTYTQVNVCVRVHFTTAFRNVRVKYYTLMIRRMRDGCSRWGWERRMRYHHSTVRLCNALIRDARFTRLTRDRRMTHGTLQYHCRCCYVRGDYPDVNRAPMTRVWT